MFYVTESLLKPGNICVEFNGNNNRGQVEIALQFVINSSL